MKIWYCCPKEDYCPSKLDSSDYINVSLESKIDLSNDQFCKDEQIPKLASQKTPLRSGSLCLLTKFLPLQ